MACMRIFDASRGFWDARLNRPRIVIGRAVDSCDVILNDPAVSRNHAEVTEADGKRFLRDLGSSCGTVVNGKVCTQCELADGMTIRMGHTIMTYMERPDNESVVPDFSGLGGPQSSPFAPDLADGGISATICGINTRFLSLPAGMQARCRLIRVARAADPNENIGDTVHIGNGGVRLRNGLCLPETGESRGTLLQAEIRWPDGPKRAMLATVEQASGGYLYVMLRRLSAQQMRDLLSTAIRGSWQEC